MFVFRYSSGAAWALLAGTAFGQLELPVSTPVPAGIKFSETAPAPLPPPPGAAAPSASPEFQSADPVQVLEDCIRFLQAQKAFYAELSCTSTLTLSGMERTNTSRSRVWLRRPDHVVWTTQGDGGSNAMAIDGKECTLYLPSLSKYTVTPITPDETVDDKLSPMVSPFGQLTSALLAADLTTTTLSQFTAGPPTPLAPEQFYGVPCHHMAVPLSGGTTAELWVAMGGAPIPVHMSVTQTLPPAAGQSGSDSRLEVDFRWKINVELPDNTFRLNLPATAMRVDQLGGPNLAAANWKPATGKNKPAKGKPIDPRKQQELSMRSTPAVPSFNSGKFTTPPGAGDDIPVPSLSQGLAGARDVLTPKKTPQVANVTPQTQQMSTPAATGIWRKPGQATQSFATPQTGSISAPVTAAVRTAPDVTLSLLNGGTVSLSQLRGKKAVVLDFWATWCGPCKKAMPDVAAVAQQWSNRGVNFYAVNMAEDAGAVQQFVKQQGLSTPVAMDTSGAAAQAFGVSGIPHLVVIGRDGSIRSVHTGASNDLRQTLMQELQSAVQ